MLNVAVKGPAHVAQAAATAGAYEAHGGHVIKMAEPVLYSVSQGGGEKAAAMNLRASWLVGRPVRGDALLSLCRVSTTQVGCVDRYKSCMLAREIRGVLGHRAVCCCTLTRVVIAHGMQDCKPVF